MLDLQIAFLGLGVMGGPMAGHLAHAGHRVRVYNRTRAKAEAWVNRHAGTLAATPMEAADGADIVFAVVSDDPDVRAVTLGEHGAFHAMRPGSIFVDHSTASAALARELAAEAQRRGFYFIDAPVSGGQAGAESGALTVMAGGDEAAFERVKPILAAYARASTWMGPAGAGQLTKMVNQICVAGVLQGLAEGVDFGLREGLDMNRVLDLLAQGAAGSWQMEHRGKTMADGQFNFGFAVDLMRKDLRICLEEADRNGAELSVARLVDRHYAEIQAMGGGRWDTSALIRRLRKTKSP
ncbi:MAG TPA: NAD(P)-dependent oxidoreductase [Burkholderiales bacterium]|jgi:3-hydroxyisobutyrate dehydrogenase and related beta-hydroxyacid dehydrogenases